ncbi:MAG: GH3 auxin-responsive promoter family protein, partial [Candidatus Omnitrophica bacterium]|nr:GH3 auxin-responsive promoter family protein [Candidatus Omnitrophota bacterium]
FVQKGLDATSLAGEKLYESQVDAAFNKALERYNLTIEFFTAVAATEETPHYAFLVEFSDSPSPEKKKLFLRAVEDNLYRENREYQFVRESQMLGPPTLKVVAKGEFERFRRKRLQEGAHDSQFKSPELTRDTNFEKNFTVVEELPLA